MLLLLRTKRLRHEGLSESWRGHPIVPSRVPRRRSRRLLRHGHGGLLRMHGGLLRMHGLLRHLVRRKHVLSVENRALLLHR